MNAPLPIMLAQLDAGVLTSAPVLTTLPDGHRVYIAKADIGTPAKGYEVLCLPPCDGESLPYALGDRLLFVFNHGTAFPVGAYASDLEHGGNRQVLARGSADVRLGARTGGAWEAVALHARLAAEVVELKAQIGVLATHLGVLELAATITPNAAADIATRDLSIGTITGGDAAAQVKARPA